MAVSLNLSFVECPKMPKVHYLVTYVAQFCEWTGQGIGGLSKQTFERLHSNFNELQTDRQNRDDREFLKWITDYNALHLS